MDINKVLVIVGPTASGKTKLSVEIAEKFNGEIISADSRQVYKNIPIATAQPSQSDLKRVKHYFVNELELSEEFNAGEFGIKGRKIIDDILSRGKLPVITGGSGLYVTSLIDGFFESSERSEKIREQLYSDLENFGEEFLYNKLKDIDPESFAKIPGGKIRRVIRAIEIYELTGKKISELQDQKIKINFTAKQFALMSERKNLYNRINERVDEMLVEGLLEEVLSLLKSGYHYKKNYSLDTVGIKEVMKYSEGEYGLEKMKEMIKQNSRRYAKRQLTWFRRDKRIRWLNSDELSQEEIMNEIMSEFNKP